jgi:hypothetical protein
VVVGVWAVLLLAAVVQPPENEIIYVGVQAAMTIVAGGLFANRIWTTRRNGNGDSDGR